MKKDLGAGYSLPFEGGARPNVQSSRWVSATSRTVIDSSVCVSSTVLRADALQYSTVLCTGVRESAAGQQVFSLIVSPPRGERGELKAKQPKYFSSISFYLSFKYFQFSPCHYDY